MRRARVDHPALPVGRSETQRPRARRALQAGEGKGRQQAPRRREPQLASPDVDQIVELPKHVLAKDAVEALEGMVGTFRQDDQPGHTQATPPQPDVGRAHQRQRAVPSGADRADAPGSRQVEVPRHPRRDRTQRGAGIEQKSKRPGMPEPHRDRHTRERVAPERQGPVAAGRRRQSPRQDEPPARGHHRCLDPQRAVEAGAMS